MEAQNGMTRAIVGVELLCFEKIIDFKDNSQPTLAQVTYLLTYSVCLSVRSLDHLDHVTSCYIT